MVQNFLVIMSNRKGIKKKNAKNRPPKVAVKHVSSSRTLKKDVSTTDEVDAKTIHTDPMIINGKTLYQCEYCPKIFSHKLINAMHMKTCPKKLEKESEVKPGASNSHINRGELSSAPSFNQDLNNDDKKPPRVNRALPVLPVSDYNKSDEDSVQDVKLNNDGFVKNRQCKHCSTLFDNPLDLLRHTRDCHNLPRTILPMEEVEKYFDYPNKLFCPICEKPIKTHNIRSVFIKHLLVHTTGVAHECTVCKKQFRRRDHMRAHEKRHVVPLLYTSSVTCNTAKMHCTTSLLLISVSMILYRNRPLKGAKPPSFEVSYM
ncbi:hypothetical protein NQ315_000258 [Exocentrus adspersus]|uniref:C2H2-type domain-containing protein n=1 Tax=Exocentrus adspersus TaxID=1586481 RepID=A0AAV8VQU4_9CUCU|nr:hypothetical protein NQ315_000258 [Exocentrus adspersus]